MNSQKFFFSEIRYDVERRTPIEHLYIHIPFCESKCAYCGFYSIANADASLQRRTIESIGRELESQLRGGLNLLPRTIYFGGGTPGILGADGLRAVASQLRRHIDLSHVEEWTCELTPATATPTMLDTLREIGVTRVSLGVQTFCASVASRMGRKIILPSYFHFPVERSLLNVESFGVDLIAGLPGIGTKRWRRDLETALSLDPGHISVYALTVEENTQLNQWVREKKVALKNDAALLDMLSIAEDILSAAGFARYEISNYARPGKECKHHLGVWRGEDFLGLGPAAVSRAGLRRWRNAPDVEGYVARLERNAEPEREIETLDATADFHERELTALRLLEGWAAPACFVEKLRALSRHGLVENFVANRWRLTRRGREVADAVTRELIFCTMSP